PAKRYEHSILGTNPVVLLNPYKLACRDPKALTGHSPQPLSPGHRRERVRNCRRREGHNQTEDSWPWDASHRAARSSHRQGKLWIAALVPEFLFDQMCAHRLGQAATTFLLIVFR